MNKPVSYVDEGPEVNLEESSLQPRGINDVMIEAEVDVGAQRGAPGPARGQSGRF